jgi:hypothetical protein
MLSHPDDSSQGPDNAVGEKPKSLPGESPKAENVEFLRPRRPLVRKGVRRSLGMFRRLQRIEIEHARQSRSVSRRRYLLAVVTVVNLVRLVVDVLSWKG